MLFHMTVKYKSESITCLWLSGAAAAAAAAAAIAADTSRVGAARIREGGGVFGIRDSWML
jgi:hypothetical protein